MQQAFNDIAEMHTYIEVQWSVESEIHRDRDVHPHRPVAELGAPTSHPACLKFYGKLKGNFFVPTLFLNHHLELSHVRFLLLKKMASSTNTPNLIFREPTGAILPHVSLYIIQFIALAAPPFRGRQLIFSAVIIGLAIQVHLNPHFTNTVPLAQPFTIAWSYYMATLAKLLFSDPPGPEANYWRKTKSPKEALAYTGFGWRKIVWAIGLVVNQRGVRWSHQVKNTPAMKSQSRGRFLVAQAVKFGECVLVADLLFQLWRRLFYTAPDERIGEMDSKYLTLHHKSYIWSFFKALVFGSTPYFMLSMQYAQCSFIAVLLGISRPQVYILSSKSSWV
jgi:hypothetical protein